MLKLWLLINGALAFVGAEDSLEGVISLIVDETQESPAVVIHAIHEHRGRLTSPFFVGAPGMRPHASARQPVL